RGVQGGDGRSRGAAACRRSGPGDSAARTAVAGGLRGVSQIRDGQMGRGHPRVRHQGTISAMKRLAMKRLTLLAALGAALLYAAPAQADDFPSKPVTMIVPFPAGGGSDILARIVAERMKTSLGQPVMVENVGGAGGTIGTARVARSAPDGYTIGFGQWTSH